MKPRSAPARFLVLVLGLLSLLPGLAAAAPLPGGVSAVREVEGIHEYRLANGLQVLLLADASQPKVIVNVTYRVGSRMESYGETGMAHLLEHMMFKSTPEHENIGAELSKRGMQFNGSTTVDRTNYYEIFPAQAAQLDWAIGIEAERMTQANVSRHDLDTEMTVVRNEMESGENNPVRILLQKTQAAAYQWHAYGHDTIGARSDVEGVNIAHLQAFYRRYYQPDNATLIVAGKFDAAQALAVIARDFGAIPKPTRVLEPPWTLEPVQDGEREVTLRRVGGEKAVIAAYHVPALASPDEAAFEVIVSALADTPNGRLHKRLVETGKATEVFGWPSHSAEPGLLIVGAELKKDDDIDAVVKILEQTVEGLALDPITTAELQRAQTEAAKEFDATMADPVRLCLELSEAIAAGDWRLLFLMRDRMQAVTLAQVNAAAAAWLVPSNRTLGRFIPTDHPVRAPAAGRVDAAAALQDFKPRAAIAAGEVFDATPANIEQRSERYTLPSGLKVVLLPKKTRGETVSVVMRMQISNPDALRGQRAAANMVGALLGTGTETRSRAELDDAFNRLQTDWRAGGSALGGGSATLQGKRATLEPALALLADVLRHPSFPASEFEQAVRAEVGGAEQGASDPGAVASLALSRALHDYAADDPRYRPTFAESIANAKALTRQQVVDFYRANWGADHAEIAIVGDFDVAATKAAIARLFGDWHAATPYVHVPQLSSTVAGLRLSSQLPDKANAIAIGVLPLPMRDTDPDYTALSVATYVLGGGGFESRLLTRLRQKEGLSYSVGAGYSASSEDAAAAIQFYAIYAPANRERVERGFAEEIARWAKDGITAQELAQAQAAIRAERATGRASDGAIAGTWARHLEDGRTFAWDQKRDAELDALTLAQVNTAIKRWVDPKRVSWSLAGDFAAKPVP
ncbi:MAG: insulinase family protein [Burkholderiales bacterium]|nr:insulinase family protein [Burkholderiales bacterium]